MLMLLRRMRHGDLTTHGFRSTFSDWAAERTAYPREVVEMALVHAVENKVGRPTGAAIFSRNGAS
jgi:integrase